MTLSHAGLARLYDEHAGALYAFLLSFTGQEADARDLLQETFVKLTGRPNRLAQARDELAFLLQTCCRLGVDWTRRHRVRTRQFGTMGIAKTYVFQNELFVDKFASNREFYAASRRAVSSLYE